MANRDALLGRTLSGAGALVALAALFLGLTILFAFLLRGARIDLTESKLYSLAPGTERIIGSLDEPINLYFFFSQESSGESPQLRAYAQRVRELLEEMAQRSKGKLKLSVIDPAPFSAEEDRATELGITPVPIGGRGDTLYFGLAGTNSTDGREVIGFFQPDKEEFLEYDVASLVHRLGDSRKRVVGLIAGLPVEASFDELSGRMTEGWGSIAQLRQLLELKPLATDVAAIGKDVDVLLVIHPKGLSPKTLYAIDQYVMGGGKLIAFVDPKADSDRASQMGMGGPMEASSSTLEPLLDRWGIEFNPGQVLGDRGLGLTVAMRQGEQPSQHIAIVGLNRDSMNSKDVVTSALDLINVMTAGTLAKKQGAQIEFEPLLQSSSDAELLPTARLAFLPDISALLEGFKPTGKRYAVAARVHGKLKSAYPDGPPAPGGDAAAHRAESAGDANLIVVADTDMLANPLWLRSQSLFGQNVTVAWANNGDFLANAVENLAGSGDLISIRGRQSFFRPFTRVDKLRHEADERLRAKEQELDRELKDTEKKLSDLQAGRSDEGSMMVSPEQKEELERFQKERVRIRRDLRDVRRDLDVEIERLGTVLKVVNIALVPALLAVGAIVLAALRRRRLRAGRAAAHTG